MLHNVFSELQRQKILAKVKNDQYIFVERSNVAHKKKHQATGGVQRLEDITQPSKIAVQQSRQLEKISRNLFKKFYHLNTNRMLKILCYTPSQSDERKFLHSNQQKSLDKDLNIDLMPSLPHLPQSTSSQQYLMELSDKVFSMGQGSLPRIQNNVMLLKNEMQNMVKNLEPILQKL